MPSSWERDFSKRFKALTSFASKPDNASLVSIKVRAVGGCFHREHSPDAYKIIDEELAKHELADDNAVFEEHETGPEVLFLLGQACTLATSIIILVTTIVKARTDGQRNGSDKNGPIEVIVRVERPDNTYSQRQVPHTDLGDSIDETRFHRQLDQAILELFGDDADRKGDSPDS